MTFNKKIILGLPLIVLVGFLLVSEVSARNTRPGESGVCIGSNGVTIDIRLPCLEIGSTQICTQADLSDECRRLGGAWGGPLPQYVGPGRSNAPIQSVNGFLQALVGVIRFFQVAFWVLTVGFGLYAAYIYLFAAGNKEEAARARRIFAYTIIAAILSVLAYAVPAVVDRFITGS